MFRLIGHFNAFIEALKTLADIFITSMVHFLIVVNVEPRTCMYSDFDGEDGIPSRGLQYMANVNDTFAPSCYSLAQTELHILTLLYLYSS